MLKNMIPIEDDTSKSAKMLAITRGMKAKDNIDNLHEKDVIQRNINTNIWECSSLQDIKNVHKFRFLINTGMKIIKYSNSNNVIMSNNVELSKKSCGIFIEFSIVHKIGYNNAILVKYAPFCSMTSSRRDANFIVPLL